LKRENYYFSILQPEYNISQDASAPMLGRNHTVSTREKISRLRQGMGRTEETKRRISASMEGRFHTEETKRKISDAKKAMEKITSVETKNKISKALGELHIVLDKETEVSNIYETGKKVAEALGCSPGTVTNYVKSGRLFKDRYLIKKPR
jgi:group I intron endonuclease